MLDNSHTPFSTGTGERIFLSPAFWFEHSVSSEVKTNEELKHEVKALAARLLEISETQEAASRKDALIGSIPKRLTRGLDDPIFL